MILIAQLDGISFGDASTPKGTYLVADGDDAKAALKANGRGWTVDFFRHQAFRVQVTSAVSQHGYWKDPDPAVDPIRDAKIKELIAEAGQRESEYTDSGW